jgi:hypothetical protein
MPIAAANPDPLTTELLPSPSDELFAGGAHSRGCASGNTLAPASRGITLRCFNEDFLNIVRVGIGIVFEQSHNLGWPAHTLPQLQAYWHCKYMLQQMIKYGKELEHAPDALPYGWAAVLYLYNFR